MSRVVSARVAVFIVVATVVAFVARPSTQATSYTLYSADGRRTLPLRTVGGVEFVSLDQLAPIFGLTIAEDAVVGGLTVQGRGQTILLIPGQSFASIGPGRVVSLPAAIQRDRGSWQVPLDFIRLVLGPSLGQRVEVRRSSRVILVGDVRLPQVTGRFERVGPNARLTFEIQPPAPHRVAREGSRLVIRFDAVALDAAPVTGLGPEFVSAVRVDGTTVTVDLGPSVAGYRAEDPDSTHLAIDLTAPGAPPPPPLPTPSAAPRGQGPPQAPPQPMEPPAVDLSSPGAIRTIVIDPGHGGADEGARGPGGTKEKDIALQMARRVKAAIENRIGLRVLLTRDTDEAVTLDRRSSLANNNKADLFFSLHVNAAIRPETRGAEVLSLSVTDYQARSGIDQTRDLPVPVAGGGTRAVDFVPWDLAQLPFAQKSASLASVLVRQLGARGVTLHTTEAVRLPLRTLVGANMPAVLVEMGFLTNAADAKALSGAELSGGIVEAIVNTIDDVRRGGFLLLEGRGSEQDRAP